MECLTPVTIVRKDMYNVKGRYGTDVVPCGKCPPCLRRRQFNWIFRLEQEQLISQSSAFITLTYNDENLPWSKKGYPTLDKTHHQLFIKRLRQKINTHFNDPEKPNKAIRYYSCGEYGETHNRPHYHSIIFNLPIDYFKHPALLDTDWQHGNTYLAKCNHNTIKYVTGYINKTLYTHDQHELDDRKKEFSLMSKGLGSSYITEAKKSYYKKVLTPFLTIEDGKKTPMPRYYKNKLYSSTQKAIIAIQSEIHALDNPLYLNEKHRHDLVTDQFNKLIKQNLLQRKTL